VLLFFAGLLCWLPGGLCLFLYFHAPAEVEERDVALAQTILGVGGGLGLLGSCLWLGAWGLTRPGRRGPRWAYVIYPQALALVGKRPTTVIRWDEIAALISPRSVGKSRSPPATAARCPSGGRSGTTTG
jgi:hypothetical protein